MMVALESTSPPGGETSAGTAARTARERSGLYGFLTEVFRAEPSPGLLHRIRDPQFAELLEATGANLGEELACRREDVLLEELAVEYTHLFLGPGRHVRPYAATYLDGAGASLCGPATVWARDFMEHAGFAPTPEHRDLADHVSVELEFMARMTAREAVATEAGDAAAIAACRGIQKAFLEDHLGRWLPSFCGQVVERAQLSFYRDLARLTGDFLDSELATVAQ